MNTLNGFNTILHVKGVLVYIPLWSNDVMLVAHDVILCLGVKQNVVSALVLQGLVQTNHRLVNLTVK